MTERIESTETHTVAIVAARFAAVMVALVVSFFLTCTDVSATDWLSRGIAQYAHGQYANAVSSLSQAVREDDGNDLAHYHLANALLKTGSQSRALQEYQRAYALSGNFEITTNCKHVLEMYHVKLPDIVTRSSRSTNATRQLTPYSTKSLEELNSMAQRKTPSSMESHSGGPEVFKESPENSGLLKEDWDRWIQNFRLEFNTDLFRELRQRGIRRPSGQSQMVFSVDTSRRLRARILRTNANENFNESLLTSTRRLDGTNCLNFPRDSKIKGFNFTMGWDYGAPKPMTREEVVAILRSRNTNANIMRPGGLGATAGRINNTGVGATLSSNDVNGAIKSGDVNGALSAGRTGALTAGQAGSVGLPSFKTDVSGLILPQEKPVELKAETGALEDPKKKKKKSK